MASTGMRQAPSPTTSYARADFLRETASAQSKRRYPARRTGAPPLPVRPASFSPSLRLGFRHLIGKQAQLLLVEHRIVHHADQDLFDRTVAEPVDDALDGLRRDPTARLGGMIDVG